MSKSLKPHLSGDWKPLFIPSKYGRYVNDHTIVQCLEGHWHLFGITSHANTGDDNAEMERYFVYANTESLDQPMQEIKKVCDNGVRAWAPGVIEHDRRYYMYYGPSPTRFATSDELTHWMENEICFHQSPLDAAHRDHFVLKVSENRWLMYATGIHKRCGVISVFESDNLVVWKFIRYALLTTPETPHATPWGSTESPYVVYLEGHYYLFITHTNCGTENYHNTLVFLSTDPTNFGTYSGKDEEVHAKLFAHAPEILKKGDQWFITTCGWRGKNTPVEGGVAITELSWI